MKDLILDSIKDFAVRRLNNAYGYCGAIDGENFCKINSTDSNGDDIIITIKAVKDRP